ncbi:ketopantoate reductase family protein [Bordetella trematum]|uniref:ketopantoate reductase family protein n=1 Tax=Bordetella trematum TaxID=123899 RepID=UPI00046E693A|nr:2-dehydropantoate 2-reductase N-terminal domain-containing protein [Bordetella trematum]
MSDRDILVWGAGAIGGTMGAYLARAGLDVTFVDVDLAHVAAMLDTGLCIKAPDETLQIRAEAYTPNALQGKWKRIFLAVKAQHTRQACEQLLPHLADDGYVVSFQNGLCERQIAAVVGTPRTVGAFINFGADWEAPGEILYSNRAAVVVGEIDGRHSARVQALHRDLLAFEPDAILSEQVLAYLWGKLAYGSFLFAQAVGQAGIADCLDRPELLPLWRGLAAEVIAVARAEKVSLIGFNGFEPEAFMPGASEARARLSVAAMADFNRPNPKTHSGVWRDLAIRKRRSEVDMMEELAALGRLHGLACPKLAAMTSMIRSIETGNRVQHDDNLVELAHA